MAEKKKMSDKVDKRRRGKLVVPGVEKPVYVSGKTQKEVDEKLEKMRKKLITGTQSTDITFVEVIKQWWKNEKKPRTKSPSTVRVYESVMNNHVFPYFHEKQLIRAVTIDDLQQCADAMEGRAESQISHLMVVLKHSFGYAIKHRYISEDWSKYLLRPVSGERKQKDYLTEDQTKRLLQAAATEKYGLFIYLCYYLGIRQGEALALRWGDIDFKKRLVHIQRTVTMGYQLSDGKTKATNRYVPLPIQLMSILKEKANMPTEYVLQNPDSPYEGHLVTSSCMTWQWSMMMYKCGLATLSPEYIERQEKRKKEGKSETAPRRKSDLVNEITPHWLRHNYVTMLFDAGVDPLTATHIVGHTSYKITADIYTHISEQRKAQATLNLDNVFSKVATELPSGPVQTSEIVRIPVDL